MNLIDAIQAARLGKHSNVRCPAHEDSRPSLSVAPGQSSPVLLHCFAGCTPESVLKAADLTWAAIYGERLSSRDKVALRLRPKARVKSVNSQRITDCPPFEEPHAGGSAIEQWAFGQLETLAALRGLSVDGCLLCAERGLLRFCIWRGQPCWVVTDSLRINAQVRRMSGQRWSEIDAKAWTFRGSRAAWPLGIGESRLYRVVLLVEGGPDLLAAHHFIHAHLRQGDAAAVALLGASHAIPNDVLPEFKGKRVRICAHADTAGINAAERWRAQLRGLAQKVDVADFSPLWKADGGEVKDLNDAAHIHPNHAAQLEDLIP